MRFSMVAIMALAAVALTGCLDGNDDEGDTPDHPYFKPADGNYHFEFDHPGDPYTQGRGDALVHFDWAPGALGKVWNKGTDAIQVGLPDGFLLVSGEDGASGAFSVPAASFAVAPDEKVFFLAPPSAHTVALTVDQTVYELDPTLISGYAPSTTQLISGETWWDLSAYQEENFPNREPGQPNYPLAVDYFATFFADLGYEVEVDPFGTRGLTDTVGCSPVGLNSLCPESLANVVAFKRGTDPDAGAIFVAGGHFDMVPQTTHAAFDDTSGTIGTMELARALAPFEFSHDLYFGLWGGEENGILGSQFWVQTHPLERLALRSYWNLDVVGMSWPAPLPEADPLVIAAGLDVPALPPADGQPMDPATQDMLAWAQTLQQDWFGFPDATEDGMDLWHYEGVVSGQISGYEAVNAQSDHTPFMAAGIPSYFIFNGDAFSTATNIHNEGDTLTNMTKYAYYGNEFDMDDPTWESPEVFEDARQALAQSIETALWFPLYHAVLVDLGVYDPPVVPIVGGP